MDNLLLIVVLLAALYILYGRDYTENFDIPSKSSSAWDWNTGPGYGAGYGSGYGLWSKGPTMLSEDDTQVPLVLVRPFTPTPQIDYDRIPTPMRPTQPTIIVEEPEVSEPEPPTIIPEPQITEHDCDDHEYHFHLHTPAINITINNNY